MLKGVQTGRQVGLDQGIHYDRPPTQIHRDGRLEVRECLHAENAEDFLALADSEQADILHGVFQPVVAGSPIGQGRVDAVTGQRITGVLRTVVFVIRAVDGCRGNAITRLEVTGLDSVAGILVVTVSVAGAPCAIRYWCVQTADSRVTGVLCARVDVVAIQCRSRNAAAGVAQVGIGAGIPIVTRRIVVGILAPLNLVAHVVSADVFIIAEHVVGKEQTGRNGIALVKGARVPIVAIQLTGSQALASGTGIQHGTDILVIAGCVVGRRLIEAVAGGRLTDCNQARVLG